MIPLRSAACVALAAALTGGGPAAAQSYPTKPIRAVVPFGAGGPADLYARFLAQQMQSPLGQSVVIENRPGAGSIIGTDIVAKSAPDGYTILIMSNTHTVNESLIPKKPGERVKTDRLDARKLGRSYRSGMITTIRIPSEAEEAVRDLVRAREDAKEDVLRRRHRLGKFLLRHGKRYRDGKAWTNKHSRWLGEIRFEDEHAQAVLEEYRIAGGSKVRVEVIDPTDSDDAKREAKERFGIDPRPLPFATQTEKSVINAYFAVAVEYGDQHAEIGLDDLLASCEGDARLEVLDGVGRPAARVIEVAESGELNESH